MASNILTCRLMEVGLAYGGKSSRCFGYSCAVQRKSTAVADAARRRPGAEETLRLAHYLRRVVGRCARRKQPLHFSAALSVAIWCGGFLPRCSAIPVCEAGERVTAYFAAAEVRIEAPPRDAAAEDDYYSYSYDYYYYGGSYLECTPEVEQCHFAAKIVSGPDAEGYYLVDWDDGDARKRKVLHKFVVRTATGKPCESSAAQEGRHGEDVSEVTPNSEMYGGEGFVSPDIPCTIMPRLHWEGSDPDWNKAAVASLTQAYEPDEVIDGFDWHVILRFNDADRCEYAFNSLTDTLKACAEKDLENCRTHKYVKAVEYVGEDPETRRRSGRKMHPQAAAKGAYSASERAGRQGRSEL